MRRFARQLALVVALGLLPSVGYGVSNFDRHPVQARLVLDDDDIGAGDTLTAAIVLTMDDHWHTYWEFSGDAGLPTKIEWDLPDGMTAGPIQWAGPTRYVEAGDLTVFGYADEVSLLTSLTLADTAAFGRSTSPAELTARVSWLVCAEICIPGDTTLTVDLAAPASGLIDPGIIAEGSTHLILPWTTGEDLISWEPTVRATNSGQLDVTVELASSDTMGGMPDLYPIEPVGTFIEGNHRRPIPGGAEVGFSVVPYAGEDLPASVEIVVAARSADDQIQYRRAEFDLTRSHVDLFATDYAAAQTGRSLWVYLIMALVGGLILNLMPCVLPVISLKVMALVSQAGESPARVRQLGLAFCGGVLATFLLLAVVVIAIKSTGELIGWGFQFQSPIFIISLGALVFVLGLSLFGVVTFRLPGDTGQLGGLADQEGLVGSFANGILATILATPCTAPFLGTALGFAFSQPAMTTLLIFTVTGIGMALPYALLAWHPGWTQSLPKPGPWMERFKQAMGFLLMATTVWLLWVLGRQLGMEAVVWTTAFFLCLAVAATLVGQWLDLRSTPVRRRLVWAISLVIVVSAYLWLIHPLVSEPLPIGDRSSSPQQEDGWQDFDRTEVESLIGEGRTVFIDFTANWCWTCKVNERIVLADERVITAFREGNVALIKADWTHRQPDITQLLHAFGRPGVPLYVIFSGGRVEDPIVLPELITADLVIDALDQSVGSSD